MIKAVLKKLFPEIIWSFYHYFFARLAAVIYGHPSEKLIVIGVTGTNGKSSTSQFIGRLLESLGFTVGWTTTAGFKIAGKEWQNKQKMTMLGRLQTQKFLRQMVKAGCHYAIIETSSQGILQSRHVGITYDIAVFTNLTPEHIEAHGGFEAYKKAKSALFIATAQGKEKKISGKVIQKCFVANVNDAHAPYYFSFAKEQTRLFGFGFETKQIFLPQKKEILFDMATEPVFSSLNTQFSVQGQEFFLPLIGCFYAYNALAAITTVHALGISWADLAKAAATLPVIPGRLEQIDEGQSFLVVVDYAYEPYALQAVYEAIQVFSYQRLIHVVGSTGGGRDKARRAVLGKMSAERDTIVIVTNEDPYEEDPREIIDEIAQAAVQAGKKEGENLFRILDRKEAIEKAIRLAQEKDLVLITGKGNEPVMAVAGGKKIPWDDRVIVRTALKHV